MKTCGEEQTKDLLPYRSWKESGAGSPTFQQSLSTSSPGPGPGIRWGTPRNTWRRDTEAGTQRKGHFWDVGLQGVEWAGRMSSMAYNAPGANSCSINLVSMLRRRMPLPNRFTSFDLYDLYSPIYWQKIQHDKESIHHCTERKMNIILGRQCFWSDWRALSAEWIWF